MNVIAKISFFFIFNIGHYTEIAQRIPKCSDMQ